MFAFPQDVVSQGSKASPEMSNYQCSMSTKDAACSAGRSLVERLCDGCRRRADGWTEGYAGSVVGCARSTTESQRRTTRPAPWYSLCRPPVFAVHRSRLTGRLAHLSLLPFPVLFRPRHRPAGRRLTSRYSILPGLVCHCCVTFIFNVPHSVTY